MKKLLSLLALSVLILSACKKDKVTQDISGLSFSTDTVFFDTVFTEIGTATRNFKVYNNSSQTLRISSIAFANSTSPFRINVNGESGKSFTDIEILPHDSIYVFVEATVNPNGGNSPLVIYEDVIFSSNGGSKSINLVAWGQDAIYYRPNERLEGLPPFRRVPNNTVWTKNKPIVIFGYLVVDSDSSLTIEAGTKIHFHGGGGLWVYKDGQITVNGTKEEPVIFQGDRLEATYKNLPGQWDRIIINGGKPGKNNKIKYAVIKNAIFGLQVENDNTGSGAGSGTSSNKLTLENTIIQNNSGMGLYARNYKIDATNVVVANAGTYGIAISGGGEYNFNYVTVANYFNYGQARKSPSFFMSNVYEYYDGSLQIRQIANSKFNNCIVYGGIDTEFDVQTFDQQGITNEYQFDHILMKRKDALSGDKFTNIYYNEDPQFSDYINFNYRLRSNSAAIEKAKPISGIAFDLDMEARDPNKPDLGAYEYKP